MALRLLLEFLAGILSKHTNEGSGIGNKVGEEGVLDERSLAVLMEKARKDAKAVRVLNTSVISLEHHIGKSDIAVPGPNKACGCIEFI